MKNNKTLKFVAALLCMAALACTPKAYVNQQRVENNGGNRTITSKMAFGKQDLSTIKEEWQDEILTETGESMVLYKYPEPERNKQLAKKGALLDAQRKLAEKVSNIKLNATTTMKDFETTDFVQSRISTYLKEVEVLSETYDEKNKTYKVSVQMKKSKLVEVLEEYFK